MGRRPKSTEEHKESGTYQKCRHAEKEVSLDALSALAAPKALSKAVADKWNEIVPAMLKAGLITVLDKAILTDAFTNYEVAQNCLAQIKDADYGVYLKGLNKVKDVNLIDEYNSHMDKFNKILMKFGVTPESRTRLRIKPKEKEPEDFLKTLMGNG